ncbi:hypothetical protein ACFL01_05115 [Planctomycetota bacterium]
MRWAVCFPRFSGKHDTPDSVPRQTEESGRSPELTDAGLELLVSDILRLAESDRLLSDEDIDEIEVPTGALTVPLSPRLVPGETAAVQEGGAR